MATNCLSLNAFAWGTSTHRNIITSAFDILKEDHKDDVYNFYKNNSKLYIYNIYLFSLETTFKIFSFLLENNIKNAILRLN